MIIQLTNVVKETAWDLEKVVRDTKHMKLFKLDEKEEGIDISFEVSDTATFYMECVNKSVSLNSKSDLGYEVRFALNRHEFDEIKFA